jgi:hypothetical protein
LRSILNIALHDLTRLISDTRRLNIELGCVPQIPGFSSGDVKDGRIFEKQWRQNKLSVRLGKGVKRKMAIELRQNDRVKLTLPKRLKDLKSRQKQIRNAARGVRRNRRQAHESRLYSDYALLYDKTFGKIFYDRIKQVIEGLHIPRRAQVLELGVGTGTSFSCLS